MKNYRENSMSLPIYAKNAISDDTKSMESKNQLILWGMICATTIICVCCVSLTGSELSISPNHFSIKHPDSTLSE